MKKFLFVILLIPFLSLVFPFKIYAAGGISDPNSQFYFLQILGENLKLIFTFSNQAKIAYLTTLTNRRVEEIKVNSSNSQVLKQIANRYVNHYKNLSSLANKAADRQRVIGTIETINLNQYKDLSRTYFKATNESKNEISLAQENSSKYIANSIEKIEGTTKAQEYTDEVNQIEIMEKKGYVVPLDITQPTEESNLNASPKIETAEPVDFRQLPDPLKDLHEQTQ